MTPSSDAAEPAARPRSPPTSRAPPREAAPTPRLAPPPRPRPRAPPCLTCAPPSAPPRRPRAPRRGTRPPRAALDGPQTRPRRPLLLRRLPAASRGARLEPLQRGREELAASAASNTKFPSVVRAAPRKCHQRPFRSAPHFRPEPQSSACRLERPPRRREPKLAGGRPGASGAAPSGGGDAHARTRARPPLSAGSSAPASRAFARARPPFDPVTSVSEGRDGGPGKARALKAWGSASRGLPSTHPLEKPFRRKLTMSDSWSHPSKVSNLFRSPLSLGGQRQLGSRELLGSDTRTNVLFKFGLWKRRGACGERATCR